MDSIEADFTSEKASGENTLLETTLSSFDARLKQLEKPEERTFLAILQKRASFLALVIGIFLSSISLYDVFWSKPREELLHDIDEFNQAVNAIGNIRQQLLKSELESQNPQLVFAMSATATPQILANIQYATALLPALGKHAGIPQLIVLISEAMNIYDWKNAEILVDRALNSSDALPSMRSEAFRYKARLMFMTGRFQEGRNAFAASLDAIENETAFGINANRAYIAADWALAEYLMGDCALGREKILMFIKYVGHPQIIAQARQGLVATLKKHMEGIKNSNGNCTIPNELKALF